MRRRNYKPLPPPVPELPGAGTVFNLIVESAIDGWREQSKREQEIKLRVEAAELERKRQLILV